MTLPTVVKDFLDCNALSYRLYSYPPNGTLQQITEAIKIPAQHLIRVVLLKDEQGLLMAILPSSHILDFTLLRQVLHRELDPLYGDELANFFKGCRPGSRPPLPQVFGLPAIADKSLSDIDGEIYFDGGAHNTLVAMDSKAFQHLLGDVRREHFALSLNVLDLQQRHAATPEEIISITSRHLPRCGTNTKIFKELPALPEAAQRILELRTSSRVASGSIAELIQQNFQLTEAIINLASAPLYDSHGGKIESLQDAIGVLGIDIVAGLGFATSISHAFPISSDGPLGCRSFWRHSIYCATLASIVASSLPDNLHLRPGLVYLGGLLHKFGYLILGYLFPAQFFLLNRFLEVNSQIPVARVEPHLLGTNNRQIGAWLMQVWGMPKEFTAAIRWHHKEDYSQPYAEYPNLVLIANRLLCSLGIGNETTDRLPATIISSLGLSEKKAFAALDKIVKSHRQLNDLSRALYV